jgi:hypothetical protein
MGLLSLLLPSLSPRRPVGVTPPPVNPTQAGTSNRHSALSGPAQTGFVNQTAQMNLNITTTVNQPSRPTQQSVVQARSDEGGGLAGVQTLEWSPAANRPSALLADETALAKDATRAAAEAYRTVARMNATIDTIAVAPEAGNTGLAKAKADEAEVATTPYANAPVRDNGPGNVSPLERITLDKAV